MHHSLHVEIPLEMEEGMGVLNYRPPGVGLSGGPGPHSSNGADGCVLERRKLRAVSLAPSDANSALLLRAAHLAAVR